MKILRCPSCAGTLLLDETSNSYICDYCGIPTIVNSYNDEKIEMLKERANSLFLACDFDGASALYQTVLAETPEDAEVYWFLALCAYGIQYVDDPVTRRKIPTCHRTLFSSILNNSNYLNAIKYADILSKNAYQEAAKRIDEIQRGILSIVEKEAPYDIFICYKETDKFGNRTKESDIAKDLYYKLTAEGYRTFYAPVTLQSYAGREFEPFIFAALNTAKLMFVIGFNKEHYNAVWVKNEWSRFLERKAKHPELLLVACYNSYIDDASVLPDELNKTQARDLSNSSTNDLVADVKKWIPKENHVTKNVISDSSASNKAMSLYKRGMLYLEDRDFQSAKDYFDKSLDDDPEFGQAYWGLLLAKSRCSTNEELYIQGRPISESNEFRKAVRFADASDVYEYKQVSLRIELKIKNKQNELRSKMADDVVRTGAKELVSASEQKLNSLEEEYYDLVSEISNVENAISAAVSDCNDVLAPYSGRINDTIVKIRTQSTGVNGLNKLSDEDVKRIRLFTNAIESDLLNNVDCKVQEIQRNDERFKKLFDLLQNQKALLVRFDNVLKQINDQKRKIDDTYNSILNISNKYNEMIKNAASGVGPGFESNPYSSHQAATPTHSVQEKTITVQTAMKENVAAVRTTVKETDSSATYVDVYLQNTGENKLSVIKIIREELGLSLSDAKNFAEKAPCIMKQNVHVSIAQRLMAELSQVGAVVTVKKRS